MTLILFLLLLGGDPNRADVRHLFLSGLSAIVLSIAVYNGALSRFTRLPWVLIAFVVAVILLPAIQMFPIGREAFAGLPGRSVPLATIDMVGGASWLAISLSPMDTATVLVSLLPPLAMFLTGLTLRQSDFFWLFMVVAAVALVSIIVGLFQFSSSGNLLNFFNSAHKYFLLGFFANRNHQGIFLALSLALTIGMLLSTAATHARKTSFIGAILIGFFVLAASVATNSRTGMVMCVASLIVGLAVFLRREDIGRSLVFVSLGIAAIAVAAVVFSSGVVDASAQRFGDLSSDGRLGIWESSVELIGHYFPFGSGLGTFVAAFNVNESLGELTPQYVNHAHNEYIELLVEAGAAAVLVVALFLVWYVMAAARAVAQAAWPEGKLPLIALFVIALFLGHSIVDYPLRTAGLAGVFGVIVAYVAVTLWPLSIERGAE